MYKLNIIQQQQNPIIHNHAFDHNAFDSLDCFYNNNIHQIMIDQVIESKNTILIKIFASHVLDTPTNIT